MAKPIRATPVLKGEAAVAFVRQMRRKERANRLSKVDKQTIETLHRCGALFDGR